MPPWCDGAQASIIGAGRTSCAPCRQSPAAGLSTHRHACQAGGARWNPVLSSGYSTDHRVWPCAQARGQHVDLSEGGWHGCLEYWCRTNAFFQKWLWAASRRRPWKWPGKYSMRCAWRALGKWKRVQARYLEMLDKRSEDSLILRHCGFWNKKPQEFNLRSK